jgi:ATP-dependent helicase HepA
VADRVSATLAEVIGSSAVLRFRQRADDERTFQNSASVRVLVCDATVEEGLNLQRAGAVLVHYDLPLEPSRIEQRIGRVDRIEARGRLRNVVLVAACAYEREWAACLVDAIGVFRRSVAPLQYVLVEAAARIRAALALEGRDAISAAASQMCDARDGLEAELRRIRAQESLDSLEVDPDRDRAFFDAFVDADERAADTGAEEFDAWTVGRLQFDRRSYAGNGHRYVYCLAPDAGHRSLERLARRRPTLLPLQDALRCFGPCIDRDPEAQRHRDELPLQMVTFDREVAEKSRIGLLRPGHAFVDAMEALVRADDRGAAFAMWRYVPALAHQAAALYLRFDLLIEADLARAHVVASEFATPTQVLRRRADDGFPVSYRTMWLDADLMQIVDPATVSLLEMPYAPRERDDGGIDTNIRLERWDAVDALIRIPDWSDFTARARRTAEQLLRDDADFQRQCQERAASLRERTASVDAALRSRVARLTGAAEQAEAHAAEFESRLGAAISDGMAVPSIRVASVGAVYLAGERLRGTP